MGRHAGSMWTRFTWQVVCARMAAGLNREPPIPSPTAPLSQPIYSVNLGAEESFKLHGKQMLKARIDVVNLTDNSYELRDGSGVGRECGVVWRAAPDFSAR